jgi:hypothetical protein
LYPKNPNNLTFENIYDPLYDASKKSSDEVVGFV